MLHHIILTLAAAATSMPAFAGDAPSTSAATYLEGGQQVLAELAKDAPDAPTVSSLITAMLAEARPVATAFGVAHPGCSEQIAAMLDLFPQLDVWSATEIRRNIEGAASLPASADDCYAARDIVAHPAIVRALAKDGIDQAEISRLIRELNEGLEHMQEIAAELTGG